MVRSLYLSEGFETTVVPRQMPQLLVMAIQPAWLREDAQRHPQGERAHCSLANPCVSAFQEVLQSVVMVHVDQLIVERCHQKYHFG